MTTFTIGFLWTLLALGIGLIVGRLWGRAHMMVYKYTAELLHEELAELHKERLRRLAPLYAANAARKAKRLDREAQARLIQQARHSEMRKLVELV